MTDIRQWLDAHGLAEYADIFEENAVDLRALPSLSEADLKELGVKLGHRRILQQAVSALQDHPPATPPGKEEPAGTPDGGEAERRQLTVMFCDLVGSTELSQRLDPEDLRTVIGSCQKSWVEAIEHYAGFVARYMGDGLLVYFGYPHAHEDDAERAVRAALEIVDAMAHMNDTGKAGVGPDLQVRIGIATGPVVVGDLIGEGASRENPVIGETPNLAARLQGIAEPGTVCVSSGTHRLVRGQFLWEEMGGKLLKGMAEPVPVWRALSQKAAGSRFEAHHEGNVMSLVGREHEVALVLDRWSQAKHGEGQVAMLVGEAGVGKSRITLAIRDGTQSDKPIRLQYQCSPHHTDSALHPVVEQLTRAARINPEDTPDQKLDKLETLLARSAAAPGTALPLFAELLSIPYADRYPLLQDGPTQKREKTLQALVDQLAGLCRQAPVLIVFEDLHWADPTSLSLLETMVERVRTLPTLVLLTCRPEFSPSWTAHGHTTSLSLNRLPGTLIETMIQRLTGGKGLPEEVIRQIIEKTDGIPLFVEELTQSILESGVVREIDDHYELAEAISQASVPATLFDSLIARLDRLGTAKEVAQLAATLGRTFDHGLLMAISTREPVQIERDLERLLEAELIYQRGRPPDVAFEFKHALVRDAAYQSLLNSTRKKYHRRVVEALEQKFPETVETQPELLAHHCFQADLISEAIAYWQLAGRRSVQNAAHDEAISHYSKALAAIITLPPSIEAGRLETELRLSLADSMRIVDRLDEALAVLDKGEKVAKDHDLVLELARIHHLRGNLYFPMGEIDGCMQEHRTALDLARRVGSPKDEASALGGIADAAYMRGRMQSAYENFNRCIELCRAHHLPDIESSNFSMVAHTRYYLNQLAAALEDGLAAAELAKSLGNHRAEIIALNAVCAINDCMAQSEKAGEHAERSLELAKQIGARRFEAFALKNLAVVTHALGRRADAIQLLKQAADISHETGNTFVGPLIRGRLAALGDDETERLAALDEGDEILKSPCVGHNYLWFYRDAIDACLDMNDWDRADRYAFLLEDYTRVEPLPWSSFLAARGRALSKYGRGDKSEETTRQIRDAIAEAKRTGFWAAIPKLEVALI